MPDRYFIDEPISGPRAVLSGAEAHHLIHVMRAEPGMEVTLFDGGGDEFSARVESVGRSEAHLSILSRQRVVRESSIDVTLGVALPKGERQRWLVEKATELGVARIVPLLTDRTVARPNEQTLTRLRRSVVEASKQCGRNRLMRIDAPQSWPDFIAATVGEPNRLLAHPTPAKRPPPTVKNHLKYVLAVGPEGGFSDAEAAAAAAAGWRLVDLGPRMLRVETAALLLAGIAASGLHLAGVQ
ncbi:MAG: 16S rRNA (uracil(1498)-N(3))-methyltransferase [Pirellulales bacterium]|nr:16S rRNA (uracil(1498)-N(3))-methyltransferase [Pirellulales bacterium]